MSAVIKSIENAFQPFRLSRNEAQARTIIAQRGRDISLRVGQTAWQLDVEPLVEEPGTFFSAPAEAWTLELTWAGARFFIQLPAAGATQLVEPLLDGAALDDLPAALSQVVLEAALSDATKLLQALGHGIPRFERVARHQGDSGAPWPHVCRLHLQARQSSAAIAGVLRTTAAGLLVIARLVSQRKPLPNPASEAFAIRLRAEIGVTTLTADVAADLLPSLEPGDVLLMAHCYLGAQRVLWLSADGVGGLHVQVPPTDGAPDAPTLTIIRSWTDSMPTPEATDTPDGMFDDSDGLTMTAASPDKIPVRLSFDVGSVTLTLSEARALQPGQVVTLGHPLCGPVNIRANGALIGDGDLVEIDGELGVSIRAIFPSVRTRSD